MLPRLGFPRSGPKHSGLKSPGLKRLGLKRLLWRGAAFGAAVLGLVFGAAPASAHPHVWVTMRTKVVYLPNGTMMGLKQEWTFDEAFSAFALQGMEKTKAGSYGDDVLKPLAEVNVTSLKEYDYFTKAKSAKATLKFKDPVDYWLSYENDTLTLHFTLPFETPQPHAGTTTFEVYDPTYFVAFGFNEKDAATLENAPAGCQAKASSPDQPQTMQLGESFFSNLTNSSNYGEQFADRIYVKCP